MAFREGDKRRHQALLSIQKVMDVSPKLKRMGLMDQGRQLEIYARWKELVGEQVAKRSRPVKFKQGVLWVAVSTPTWMQQLTMLKPTLLQALHRELGEKAVRDIRLTTRDYDASERA